MYTGHEHGSEYQLKFVLHNGEEDRTDWLTQEQLVQAMAIATASGRVFWLVERNVICVTCPDRKQQILEYPVAQGETPRCRPRDSRYLIAAGVRNRSEIAPPR
jgi:hypothetical protein